MTAAVGAEPLTDASGERRYHEPVTVQITAVFRPVAGGYVGFVDEHPGVERRLAGRGLRGVEEVPVVVLRCTQKLLRRLREAPSPDVPVSDTKLGDWYGTDLQVGQRRFALFMSERTRLPVVLEGADLKRLPDALAERLGRMLAALGVDDFARAEECARMAAAVFAATSSRSLVGSLNEAVSMARPFSARSPVVTPLELALDLAEVPIGPLRGASSGDATLDTLGRKAAEAATDPVDLIFLSNCGMVKACKRAGSGGPVWLRARRFWGFVPGEILSVRQSASWTDDGRDFMSGAVVSRRIDARALGLAPLRLEPMGEWNPADEYWGEDGDPIDDWAKPIIARGPRPRFEMEQVLPGADPDDPDSDPICLAIDRKDRGDRYARATP